MSLGQRIRAARTAAGHNQSQLGDLLGFGQTTVGKWERDEATPTRKTLRAIELLYSLPQFALELDDERINLRQIALMGELGAGQAIRPPSVDFPMDYIDAPPGAPPNAQAAIVRGSSMMPAYRNGNILVWWRWSEDVAACVGIPSVCRLADDSMVVKIVERSAQPHRWDLVSINAAEDTLRGVRVLAAAPVEIVLRSAHWR